MTSMIHFELIILIENIFQPNFGKVRKSGVFVMSLSLDIDQNAGSFVYGIDDNDSEMSAEIIFPSMLAARKSPSTPERENETPKQQPATPKKAKRSTSPLSDQMGSNEMDHEDTNILVHSSLNLQMSLNGAINSVSYTEADMMEHAIKHEYLMHFTPVHVTILTNILPLTQHQNEILMYFIHNHHRFKCSFLLDKIIQAEIAFEHNQSRAVFEQARQELLDGYTWIHEPIELIKWPLIKSAYNILLMELKYKEVTLVKNREKCVSQISYRRTHNNIRVQMDYEFRLLSAIIFSVESLFRIHDY